MWYYAVGEDREGPLTLEELDEAIRNGHVRGETYVWTEGMADWQEARQVPQVAARLPLDAVPADAPPSDDRVTLSTTTQLEDTQRLDRLYRWLLITWIGGILTAIICIGFAGIIAGVVLYCILLHRCWSLIPREWARTSPDLAVGLQFVPLFNLYWVFVAVLGLAKDMNRLHDQLGLSGDRVNEGLALTYCILICCTWIPYLGLLVALAAVIIHFFVTYQIKEAANRVIRHRAGASRGSAGRMIEV